MTNAFHPTIAPRPAKKSPDANRAALGENMHKREIEVGALHADLWEELVVSGRWVSGPHDITVGDHLALGRCTVSHYGLEYQIVWMTERPIFEPTR